MNILWITVAELIWCAAGSWIGFRIEGKKTEDEREEINRGGEEGVRSDLSK
jgi:hypothetical protein